MAIQWNNQSSPSQNGAPATPTQGNGIQWSNPDAQTLSSIGSGLGSVLNNVEQPFVSVAATPVQLLSKALGRKDPYNDTTTAMSNGQAGVPGLNGQGVAVAPVTPAGFLQKAGQVAQIGTLAVGGGELGIAKMAGIGAASGAAQDIAGGDTNPSNILKNTIYGGLFGMAIGTGGKFLSFMGKSEIEKTGVQGAIQDAIQHTDPDLLASYINASKGHGETMASLGSPTAIGLSEDEFDRRATILTDEVIPKAGQAVGDAKASAGALPVALKVPSGATIEGVDAVNAAADNINTAMQNMTGHQFSAYGEAEPSSVSIQNYPEGASTQGTGLGEESGISQLPGRSVDLSKAEKTQLENLSAQLEKLRNSPTVTTASDVLTNINTDIGKWDNPQFGSGNSPVQGVLKYSYGQIKAIVAEADPALSAANSTYHDLMNLKSQIANQAGQTGQSSALLMRRVLSGDKSNSVVPLLQKLDAVTAPFRNGDATSLVQQAILADWSTSLFGDETTRQLLSKAVSQGNRMAYAETSIFGYPRVFMNNLVKGAMAALSPDPAAYAMSIAKGEDFSLNPLARYIDNQMNKTTSIPIIGAFTQQLKNWGVSANNAESSAKVLFKMFLLQQLTRQNGTSNPSQGGPFTLPVNNTISYPPSSQSASSSPLSMANANQTASAIRSLTPPQTGQAMGRTLGVSTPGKLSMSSSLS